LIALIIDAHRSAAARNPPLGEAHFYATIVFKDHLLQTYPRALRSSDAHSWLLARSRLEKP
jgi:hypothetical protein